MSKAKRDFIYLMGLFRNGIATREDAERLWDILKGDDEDGR